MKRIHIQEKEQFIKLFQHEHSDRFEDRFSILETFLNHERHLTVDELVELLNVKGFRFEPEFIKSTLQLMTRFGFAQPNQFDNGVVRYEHRHLGHHHDHMICTKCKKIIEFQDNALEDDQVRIAENHGFHLLQHKMELYGICSECFKEREKMIPLSSARPGERLVIKDLTGGMGSRIRLLSMGLRPGDEVEVVSNQGKGQLVVALDLKRFIIGRGQAEKILAEPKEE
ncbi:MAG: Fur family transcriptional regulator [Deltaproteobacteria bacterium RBG_13_49_15]|nr:MAG: Fur family transcriptional regulator [Deltaproteobacteria bacterium RBG_13_49_15]